eukprot:6469620-Prymnesium_polylepis.1
MSRPMRPEVTSMTVTHARAPWAVVPLAWLVTVYDYTLSAKISEKMSYLLKIRRRYEIFDTFML